MTNFKDLDTTSKLKTNFPFAVFGTLRNNCGNNHLMHLGKIKSQTKGFIRHFYAHQIRLHCCEGSTVPVEIFEYEDANFNIVLDPVDSLEGFHIKRASGVYHRTLMEVNVLPNDFKHDLFPSYPTLWGERDLEIPQELWAEFPTINCWVYSFAKENEKVNKLKDNPIVWCP